MGLVVQLLYQKRFPASTSNTFNKVNSISYNINFKLELMDTATQIWTGYKDTHVQIPNGANKFFLGVLLIKKLPLYPVWARAGMIHAIFALIKMQLRLVCNSTRSRLYIIIYCISDRNQSVWCLNSLMNGLLINLFLTLKPPSRVCYIIHFSCSRLRNT